MAYLPFRSFVSGLTLLLMIWFQNGSALGRPNVVIVIADDQTWFDAGCYGNAIINTPNIDRLAADGLKFNRAFTSTAMCAPTRQQLYTGIFPVRSGAFPNHSSVKPGTRSLVHYFREAGYDVGLCGKKHFGPRDSFPFTTVTKNNLGTFLSGDDPFFLVYASNSPHLPWSEGDPGQYDKQKIKVPPYLFDNEQTRAAMVKYYAEITDFDRELGEVDEQLRAAGKRDDTIFIYTSEQGAQFPYGKWTCYEVGLHVGLIMRWPHQIAGGSQSDALVQYVDVLPTLLDLCKIDVKADFDGRSFSRVIQRGSEKHNEFVFGVHTTRGIIHGSESYPVRSIRSDRYKLILNLNHKIAFQNTLTQGDGGGYWKSWVAAAKNDPQAKSVVQGYVQRPRIEFYDLLEDPFERINLADDPLYSRQIAKMNRRLQSWMTQQGDRGDEPERTVKPHRTMLTN